MALRLGALKPDWRSPNVKDIAADWKEMQVPGQLGITRAAGLRRRRLVHAHGGCARGGRGRHGEPLARRDAEHGEVWVNGLALTATGGRGGGGGRGGPPPAFALPAGTLRPGVNQITVRIQNARLDGGFIGTADQMFLEAGGSKTPIAGPWKYRVERQTNAGTLYTKPRRAGGARRIHGWRQGSPAPPARRSSPSRQRLRTWCCA